MKIIPMPQSLATRNNGEFHLTKLTKFINNDFSEDIFLDIKLFLSQLNLAESGASNEIKLILDDSYTNDEEYRITIAESGVAVMAKSAAGAYYAIQSLKQLLIEYNCKIPAVIIKDYPRFAYRAFMLDVGRYFYPIEDIKRYIDLMSSLKMNYFHWHLTEDQGWRVEIKKYPLLTEKGSSRSHTNFGFKSHGGYYTQEEIKEVVKYCHDRFVKVIPEFDVPGHCVSAISCYPHLSCFNRELQVATHWGVKHDILCAGKESTYQFIFDVLDELCELFTDGYFHIGGDEAVKTRWKACPHCQAEIKRLGLHDEEELQEIFMNRVNRHLRAKGYECIMWNWDNIESVKHLDKDIIWQYCGNLNNDVILSHINKGMNIVLSTSFANYLDFPYGWANLKMTYNNPTSSSQILKPKNIRGIEAPLWTEYVPNTRRGDYLTFPRLCAVAELAWCNEDKLDYNYFVERLSNYNLLLDMFKVNYAIVKQSNPSKWKSKLQSIWFNRRQLHWQGLHNLIDNAIVEGIAKKYKVEFDSKHLIGENVPKADGSIIEDLDHNAIK